MNKENAVITFYKGFFRKELSLFEGVALLLSGIIGAGVLAIPYAIAQVGLAVGLAYIFGLGTLMMGLHLMLGEITVRTKQDLQLAGLARKYLGKPGWLAMSLVTYLLLFGVLVVYMIGTGESLQALFGGSSFSWSLIFFSVVSYLVSSGLKTIKKVETFLVFGILLVVIAIVAFAAPHIEIPNLLYFSLPAIFLPYGVILFAFHGTTSVPEVHALLRKEPKRFKYTIIYAHILVMMLYALFAIATIGVTGTATTEIATLGLGQALGQVIFWLGNIFAVLAMSTSFLMVGVALRDSFTWDLKVPNALSSLIVLLVPLVVFILGLRQFITALDIVGGVFGSIEMLLIIMIYWRAKQMGDLKVTKYKLHNTLLLAALLVIAFTFGAIYSVAKLF